LGKVSFSKTIRLKFLQQKNIFAPLNPTLYLSQRRKKTLPFCQQTRVSKNNYWNICERKLDFNESITYTKILLDLPGRLFKKNIPMKKPFSSKTSEFRDDFFSFIVRFKNEVIQLNRELFYFSMYPERTLKNTLKTKVSKMVAFFLVKNSTYSEFEGAPFGRFRYVEKKKFPTAK
jgi:hypothetical protein